ncbi:vanadium-dependent haloperoxidase [Akkermansiaceae bacterium]|nr:vanadium-dependent haloperoxidase [Akkermansiaceae bacterium]
MKILAVLLCLLLPVFAGGDESRVIERWNQEFRNAIRRQAMPPCLVARNLAILHLTIWRAVESAGEGNEESAACAAAYTVCTTYFSGDRVGFEKLLTEFPAAKGDVFLLAKQEAEKILESRADDGANTTVHYKPELAAGIWQRTTNNRPPELPHWQNVKPFVIASADAFRPPPPPALESKAYSKDVALVRDLGGKDSAKRTKDQEETARFWSDFSYTDTPPGRWNEIASQSVAGKGFSISKKAKVFAVLNVAMADAGIAAWDCKFFYRFWRPESAIHESIDDRNTLTVASTDWKSLLPSPSHPEYVSGHSTFSGAASRVLDKYLGKPSELIRVTNPDMPGVIRSFGSFDEIAAECGQSRIYGGIHFPTSNREGLALGRKVADRVVTHYSEP